MFRLEITSRKIVFYMLLNQVSPKSQLHSCIVKKLICAKDSTWSLDFSNKAFDIILRPALLSSLQYIGFDTSSVRTIS